MAGFDPGKSEWTNQPFNNGSIQSQDDGRIGRDELHDKLKDVNTGGMSIKAQAWTDAQGTLDAISGAIAAALTTVKQSWKSDGAQLAYDRLHVTQLSADNIAKASGEVGSGISKIVTGVETARGSHGASSENFGDDLYNAFGGDGNTDAASATWAALLADVNHGLGALPTQLETQLKSQGANGGAQVMDVGSPDIPTGSPSIGPGGTAGPGGSVPTGSIPKPPDSSTGIDPGTTTDTTRPPIDTTEWPPRNPTTTPTTTPTTGGPDYPGTGTITDPTYGTRVPSLDTSSQLAGVGDGGGFGSGSSAGGFGGSGSGGLGSGSASGLGGGGAGSGAFGGAGAGAGGSGLSGAGSASGLSGRGGLSGSGTGLAGGGSASGSGTAGAGSAGAGRGGMMGGAPMGGGRGGGGGADDDERERTTWLTEDEDVWGATKAPPGVIS